MLDIQDLKFNCHHFKGYIPCKPNKIHDVACNDCEHYEIEENKLNAKNIDTYSDPVFNQFKYLKEIFHICKFDYNTINTKIKSRSVDKQKKRILFIKLGAIGDVIRTTPLVTRYNKEYENCHFTWVTHSPQVLPKNKINKIYKWNGQSVYEIIQEEYDIAINLDKDIEACMLLHDVEAKNKFGFTCSNYHIDIATKNAKHKLITGLFDHISKKNTKNYLEEIFEICHFDFNMEEYMINLNEDLSNNWKKELSTISENKPIIGLNTGCGERWKTRLWPKEYWIELINHLDNLGYFCLLMGGPDEDERNKYYASKTQAKYLGCFSLEEFIAISNNTDIIVTPVSMMMHIALALKKQMMLFHNIFNAHEFELYNRGIIIEPESGCDCYFGNTCSREKSCMYDVSVKDVLTNIAMLRNNIKK